jgi:hypothetical protein
VGVIKKRASALFLFIPIEQPFEQWSRAAQAKFVPTRVAVSAGNKRLLNGEAQSDYKKTRTECDCQRQKQWTQWDDPAGGGNYFTTRVT